MKLSIGQGLASAKVFFKRMSQVPTGFKKLFFETKDALVLYSKKQSQARSAKKLKRREEELIRSNFASVQKLIVYFFLQLPPIIGIIPVRVLQFIFLLLQLLCTNQLNFLFEFSSSFFLIL